MIKKIQLFKPVIDEDDIGAVVNVLRSGWIAHGMEVEMFEREFADYIRVSYSAAVSNGTVALALTLKALGVGQGDEVLVPDYTFIATATAVLMVGAIPRFTDVEYSTFNIDVNDLQEKITGRTKAIIAVHLFGQPANVKALIDIARDRKLILIEDAAQAHGAEAWNQKVGSFGDAAVFSFYATKNMTTGEGGMVVSNNKNVIERVKLLRNHGQVKRYVHVELGGNYRITSIQAALGRAQLRKLDRLNDARRNNAGKLNMRLSHLKEYIELPYELPWAKHVYHIYAIKIKAAESRECLQKCLDNNGIETAVHYPLPLHMQPLFQSLGY
ncbi:MAG: DegT/DnrJ/EryC1/StrS family aminotransferase, partial [Ignisphaera sp.]|nr:DegT/DnrJ/EryC1/StrS family aminotransferase [Ignisphaera sp.]